MSRGWMVLLCVVLVGCSGTMPSVRKTPESPLRCVHLPRRAGAPGLQKEAAASTRMGMHVVLEASAPGAPLAPRSTPLLKGPLGVLRLVPGGAPAAETMAGGAVGETVVVGGAVVAVVGSGLLFCLTASAAADGEETPIDVADTYYGTHFGDMKGWVQGRYSTQTPPGAVPRLEPEKSTRKRLGRIYVTYTKLNKTTQSAYAGRTSMVIDLDRSLEFQAVMALLLRDKNHHTDENAELKNGAFADAEVDRFDVGSAIDYDQRYGDVAYWRIRGREQQLIASLGGARSDTGRPYRTENAVRGVAKDNPRGRQFDEAATAFWGPLHTYTGY